MNTAQRRTEILKLLHQAEKPVAARALAAQFGVSRQVIVQDMAVIGPLHQGFCLLQKGMYCSRIKTAHVPENLKSVMDRNRQRRN